MGTPSTPIDTLKRECRTLETYIEQRLQAKAAPVPRSTIVDLEAGASAHDPDAQRLREVDEALLKLSQTVEQLSEAAQSSGARTNVAVAQRYREVIQDYRSDYRSQLASLRARRENELLYAHMNPRKGGPAETSATDILLRERGSLLSGLSGMDEIMQQAARTKEALAQQRTSLMGAAGRVGGLLTQVPGLNIIMRSISRHRLRNDVVLGLTIAACICFILWWTVLSSWR